MSSWQICFVSILQNITFSKEKRINYLVQKDLISCVTLALIPPGADPGFGQGGAPASEAENCRRSEAESRERSKQSLAGVQGLLKGPGSFGFLMLKYAFSHILETLFLSFLTSILTPNVDKNRALEFTSINLRHSYILHLFFNLHEKVML